jgi:hypothetical protein
VLLFPVSKLLEYAGAGTLENPTWKPVLMEGAAETADKSKRSIQARSPH